MHGVDAGISVDKIRQSGIITKKGGIMRKVRFTATGVILLFSVSLIFTISGCCPYSKKKVEKTESIQQPSQQPSTPAQPLTPATVTPPSDSGRASPSEVAIATKGEEIPPVKSETQVPTFVEPGEAIKDIFQPIYFDFDKYNIRNDQQTKLKNLADYLKKNPAVSILIEGHCDERGTDEYNLVLGEQRALSTRKFLIGLGIAPKRLYTISYGESMPADPGHNEEAWAKNRRCEFKIKQ